MFLTLLVMGLMLATGCKKKDDDNNNGGGGSASASALVIQTGAQTISPDGSLNYSAVVVDSKGNTTPATGVTWSVSNNLGAFTGSTFKPSTSGYGTVTASATVGGKTLTAQVAVGVYLPALFSVVPSAIVWTTNAGNIPLLPVYLGTGSVSGYTYASSNTAVASVDASGNVTFNATGECVITVTANGLSGNNKVYVPVVVVGMPTEALPVVRVAVTPGGKELFRNETHTFSAKAFNSANAEVATTFTWASNNTAVATVDASGKVTAVGLGKALITATALGITGQAEVDVLPDTAIIVTPITASITPGGNKQLTATAYAVNRTTRTLSAIPMPPGLTWEVPTTGISMFDFATVSSTGLVSVAASATPLLSTVAIAHVASPTIEAGASLIIVSDCNCGAGDAGVAAINVAGGSTRTISIMSGPATVTATAVDGAGSPVPGAAINLCSDNISVATVDNSTGQIIPVGPGTAIITVCNGGVSTTITVTVTF